MLPLKINDDYKLDTDMIKIIIAELGYKTSYDKREKFFKVDLDKTKQGYIIRCHLKFNLGFQSIDGSFYIFKDKKYFAGSLFAMMYDESNGIASGINPKRPYFKDENLKLVLNDILSLANEFKKALDNQSLEEKVV